MVLLWHFSQWDFFKENLLLYTLCIVHGVIMAEKIISGEGLWEILAARQVTWKTCEIKATWKNVMQFWKIFGPNVFVRFQWNLDGIILAYGPWIFSILWPQYYCMFPKDNIDLQNVGVCTFHENKWTFFSFCDIKQI